MTTINGPSDAPSLFFSNEKDLQRHVYLIEDHADLRVGLTSLLEIAGYKVYPFISAVEFLHLSPTLETPAVLVTDMRMPDMDGGELQAAVIERFRALPIIFISGESTVEQSVKAMKQGALDFLTKPFTQSDLLQAISTGIDADIQLNQKLDELKEIDRVLSKLCPRERHTFDLLALGLGNAELVREMGISTATVKQYKSQVFDKLGVTSLSELISMAKALKVQ